MILIGQYDKSIHNVTIFRCTLLILLSLLSLYLFSVSKGKERDQSPSGAAAKEQKTPQGTAKGGKAKGKDKTDKADKSKAAGATSRPPSVSFDVGKPHWTLRVVSDAPSAVRNKNLISML